eukprot:TRINITY_DN9314_c0_g1_i2.p1 TRINITY_DN9314_c0_g1~~TRINITY_DN9314_c0_g1_i2.p1  ORF type:complete len:123 (-),score=26.76 TRINITY_DN9314_c0_g1_i2:60-428(-)
MQYNSNSVEVSGFNVLHFIQKLDSLTEFHIKFEEPHQAPKPAQQPPPIADKLPDKAEVIPEIKEDQPKNLMEELKSNEVSDRQRQGEQTNDQNLKLIIGIEKLNLKIFFVSDDVEKLSLIHI